MKGKKKFNRPREKKDSFSSKPPTEEYKDGLKLQIPSLKHGPNTNYISWKRSLASVAMASLGSIGRVVNENRYTAFDLPAPPPAATLTRVADPYEIRRKTHQRKVDLMLTRQNEYDESKVKLWGLVMQHVSLESEQKIREHEDFEDALAHDDVLRLLEIIGETHKGFHSGVTIRDKEDTRRAFANFSQNSYETLLQYKERLEHFIESFETLKFIRLLVTVWTLSDVVPTLTAEVTDNYFLFGWRSLLFIIFIITFVIRLLFGLGIISLLRFGNECNSLLSLC